MDINNLIKSAEFFKQYPFLRDELTRYSDEFVALNSPLAEAVVSQVNLEQVSRTSGLDASMLVVKTKEIIAAHQT